MKIAINIKKIVTLLGGLALLAQPALAAVNVTSQPVSLVTSPMFAKASSGQIGLFSFSLNQDAGETLSSVTVTINNAGSSTAVGSHLASVSVYKDEGDGNFDSTTDLLAGSETTVNIGSATTVSTGTNNTIAPAGSKFFVSLATSGTWTDATPVDSVTVTLAANALVTSANSPTVTAATTATITADITAPTLLSAMAKNTGGTAAKEAGDSIDLTFSESTNKPVISAANIATVFNLNNSHSFLDGATVLGSATWSIDGKTLSVVLSAGTSLPTVTVGDTVSVNGSIVTDLAGNVATGSQIITGSFTSTIEDGDEDDNDEGEHHACANTLINGRLYKVGTDATVYLAAACRLKPFRGAAVFHARGEKFQNIITLDTLPANVTVSQKPVLPAEGTLVKGNAATVFFIDHEGHKRGFISANIFAKLGFSFNQVMVISQSDLDQITLSTNISNDQQHPDGSLIKCGGSAAVFEVIGAAKFPFASADAFQSRGHSFSHILIVDCGRFRYVQGAAITAN